ncbi:MAG: CCA tRNA nucleotidyltransferase [Chlamydiae bacterium CG10_big_fil_rev_8_21_14_0_10_42_34]|nr:MAG: CCA tRNA nucleotidyltransferase [Chlamydiae bacterium CG10_big_fil_rev_8_21_14_0_10_42_34]
MEEHPQARHIVETLAKAGFIAYYAGGWVRDLLINHPSDDIDIATNAPPETVQALFPHTVPVGIAFGIVIVIIEGHQYEVATFRQDLDYKDGRRPSRIEFTTAIEDAKRRDFTINGMFYDPLKDEVLDYVNGKADLEAKIIRAIGNPHERIKEDRLRMIRAIRLACRFNFHIEEATAQAIADHAKELFPAVAIERIWQEFTKGHNFGKLRPMLIHLHEFGLLESIFPSVQNTPLKEIEKRLAPIKDYPAKAPVIASLLPLFPDSSLEDQLELCKKLKLSNIDRQFVTFLFHAKELVHLNRPVEKVEWAYFYANSFSSLCLQIISSHFDARHRIAFLHEHEEQIDSLQKSIERIKNRDPIVKSDHLLEIGIQPGVAMGILLKEADRIAINEQLHEVAPIIERLKTLPIWPK